MFVSNAAPARDGHQLFRRWGPRPRPGRDRGSSGHRGDQDLVRVRPSSRRKTFALRRHRRDVSDHPAPEPKRGRGGREVDRLRTGEAKMIDYLWLTSKPRGCKRANQPICIFDTMFTKTTVLHRSKVYNDHNKFDHSASLFLSLLRSSKGNSHLTLQQCPRTPQKWRTRPFVGLLRPII